MFPAVVMLEPEVDLDEWPPFGPLRLADEMHARFARRPIGFPCITRDTRADDILPCRGSTPIARDHVIEVQIFAIELAAAELAGVLVALENVVPCEFHFLLRQAIEQHQQDHPGNANPE